MKTVQQATVDEVWMHEVSERVGMDWVFLRLAGLLLKTSLGLRLGKFLRAALPALGKTLSIPPLLLGLTQSMPSDQRANESCNISEIYYQACVTMAVST